MLRGNIKFGIFGLMLVLKASLGLRLWFKKFTLLAGITVPTEALHEEGQAEDNSFPQAAHQHKRIHCSHLLCLLCTGSYGTRLQSLPPHTFHTLSSPRTLNGMYFHTLKLFR